MKAAYITARETIEFREDDIPSLGPGEALVRIAYTGICGSDLHAYHGRSPSAVLPVVPGHEYSGVIEEIAEGSRNPDDLKPGDKVVGWIILACGACDACIAGHTNLCRNLKSYGTQTSGTFREYLAVPLRMLYKLPTDADLRLYALAEPMAVAVYAVRETPVLVGDSVYVIGGGPIGVCTAIAARRAGASMVVISEICEEKRERIETMGFPFLNPGTCDPVAEAMEMTNGRGFSCVLEASASKAGYELMTKVGSFRAKAINIGQTRETMPLIPWDLMKTEMRLKAIRIHPQAVFGLVVEMFKNADKSFTDTLYKLISHDYSFDRLQEAFDVCAIDRSHCKVMVKVKEA